MGLNAASIKKVCAWPNLALPAIVLMDLPGTCHYNHDFASLPPNGAMLSVPPIREGTSDVLIPNRSKKSLNVESPAFTPKSANVQPVKSIGISPKAVAAAAFTPRGSGTATPATVSHSKEPSAEFVPASSLHAPALFQEFVPGQTFVPSKHQVSAAHQARPAYHADDGFETDAASHLQTQLNAYGDPFLSQATLPNLDAAPTHLNPYAQQAQAVGSQPFYQDTSSFKHPLNYHLYASIGPRRENLMPYQRSTADFFIPDDLREDLQRKSEATLQTFANSTLPLVVEHYHSLVALDTNKQKGPSIFGYPSSVYKAISSKDGNYYTLRRIEGIRLTDGAAITKTMNTWKRISTASAVQVHEAFTGKHFGDGGSLIVVTDYHPRSQTMAEKHFPVNRHSARMTSHVSILPESELWGYIVQLASALKAIHDAGTASQTIVASKILVTSKNRIRVNGGAVFDIITYDQPRSLQELQRGDLQSLGHLILDIAVRSPGAHQNINKALEIVGRSYTERLRGHLAWLVNPPPLTPDAAEQSEAANAYNITAFLTSIADRVVSQLNSALHYDDELTANMMRELENGRLVRLMTKLNIILERPDASSTPIAHSNPAILSQPSASWSETGERYYLKLFRDYVFHQIDHDGRPVLDLGHIITCLNKLDAGVDEKMQLISRDEQTMFIVSYKEVKRGFEAAWAEISKASSSVRR